MINENKPLLVKIRTGWMCTFPPHSTMMHQCTTAIKPTPKEAYDHCMALLNTTIWESPIWETTPASRRRNELWDEAERRQQMGLHRPWSSLDCKVRNGY